MPPAARETEHAQSEPAEREVNGGAEAPSDLLASLRLRVPTGPAGRRRAPNVDDAENERVDAELYG